MKALKILLIIMMIPVMVFICVGIGFSNNYSATYSFEVKAPIDQVHSYVGDLEKWPLWNPWQLSDETVVIILGDITQGVGASQSWEGKKGEGRLVITKAEATSGIEFDEWVDDKSQKGINKISYEAVNGNTMVTWTISGEEPGFIMGGWHAKMMMMLCPSYFQTGLSALNEVIITSEVSSSEPAVADEAKTGDVVQ